MQIKKNEMTQAKQEYKNEVRRMLREYKYLLAKHESCKKELAELNGEVTVAGLSFGRTKVQTSGINKSTEFDAIRKLTAESELLKKIYELEQKMKIIRDAVNHLDHDKAAVIRMRYIERYSWTDIIYELFICEKQGRNRIADSITPLAFMIFGAEALEESIIKIS